MASNKIFAGETGQRVFCKFFWVKNRQLLVFVLEYKTRKGPEKILKDGHMLPSAHIEPCYAEIHLVHQCSQCGFQKVIKQSQCNVVYHVVNLQSKGGHCVWCENNQQVQRQSQSSHKIVSMLVSGLKCSQNGYQIIPKQSENPKVLSRDSPGSSLKGSSTKKFSIA